ncbi:MAG: serine/threonine protein kinase [Polyangiaceae bacterium]
MLRRLNDDDLDELARERIGSVLDEKWTIETLLGVGGMAAVYEARHRNGARAAIKILHPELSRNKEVCERFRREGYAANLVEHPGVVKVLDDDVISSGPNAGTAYLVMELLSGQLLQDRLERGPAMGEIELLELATSILEVLDAAHARGVIHRDLKPENLFLWRDESGDTPKRRIKILDFGLARIQEGVSITTNGLALGTPSFMSPEQAAGRSSEIDGRTDLFALTATLFRVRTGRRIHEASHPVELVTKMASLPAPPIRSVCPDVSAPFERVVDKGLQFHKEDRYKSAAEMSGDVRRALAELEGAKTQKATGGAGFSTDSEAPPSSAALEVSESDIVKSQYGLNESIRIPKRRSVVPWLLLLLLLGGGAYEGRTFARPWIDRIRARVSPVPPAASETAPATSSPTSSAEAGASAASAPSIDAGAPVVAAPTASTAPASRLSPEGGVAHAPASTAKPAATTHHGGTPKKKNPSSPTKTGTHTATH